MQLDGLFIIGFRGIDLGGKGSDMAGFVVEVYASGPFFFVLVSVDALIFRDPISRRLIATVLGVCA